MSFPTEPRRTESAGPRLPGPSPFALAYRFVVLLGLIARAALLYLRLVLDGRGLWRLAPARRVEIQRRFAARFVRVAMRFRGSDKEQKPWYPVLGFSQRVFRQIAMGSE